MSNGKRQHQVCTDVLPIDVTLNGSGFPPESALEVVLMRAGHPNVAAKLDIVNCTDCEIVVRVPAKCAQLGAGRYHVRVFDNCTAVCTIQLELAARCRIDEVSYKAAQLSKGS